MCVKCQGVCYEVLVAELENSVLGLYISTSLDY